MKGCQKHNIAPHGATQNSRPRYLVYSTDTNDQKGETLLINVMGQRNDLVVISTNPSGPVIVRLTKITSFSRSQHLQLTKEGGVPSITYEDIGGGRNEVTLAEK